MEAAVEGMLMVVLGCLLNGLKGCCGMRRKRETRVGEEEMGVLIDFPLAWIS